MTPLLSRTQRNEIFDWIRKARLDPADFEWTTVPGKASGPTETLRHHATDASISFSNWENGWWISWWPSQGQGRRYEGCRAWSSAATVIQSWFSAVEADHVAPDLWGEVAKEKIISNAADQPDSRSEFKPEELKELEARLGDIEQYLTTTQALAPDQREDVRRRFDYLREAAQRGPRKIDWLNIFVGQVVAMVAQGLLDSKHYGPVMAHAAAALNS